MSNETQESIQVTTWRGKTLVSAKELHELLDGAISLPNIYNLAHKKGFPVFFVGRKALFPVQEVLNWFQQQRA